MPHYSRPRNRKQNNLRLVFDVDLCEVFRSVKMLNANRNGSLLKTICEGN